tara:strand:+ start:190 stop:681 length:492 start_codon:yes stop_codon:yes gene_type:complete
MISKLVAFLLFSALLAQANADVTGRVKRVVDGDTIILQEVSGKTVRIRLLGIDAPESGQPYGDDSSATLASYIEGKMVYVASRKKDRYQRLLGKVIMNKQDINYLLVKKGHAWHYKRYSGDQDVGDAQQYADAESEAKQSQLGIWKALAPIPPWEWRRKTLNK